MTTRGKKLKPDERDLFEATGAKLHGWGERDYELNDQGEYTFLEQRNAFAIWLAARACRVGRVTVVAA